MNNSTWKHIIRFCAVLYLLLCFVPAAPSIARAEESSNKGLVDTVKRLASQGDRSTGSPAAAETADFILNRFKKLGIKKTGTHIFSVPVLRFGQAVLESGGQKVEIHPIRYNAVSPAATPHEGLQAPLVYAGKGELREFKGKTIKDSILLMELASGKNWLNAASLGAKALVFIDRGDSSKFEFMNKFELTPIDFPIYRISLDSARKIWGDFEKTSQGVVADRIKITSSSFWKDVDAENVYALIPGTNDDYEDQLIIVEAFYDSTDLVPGLSPGAEQALGVASLLELAEKLTANPPERSILLTATGGHFQSLAGMREMIYSMRGRSREMRKLRKRLKSSIKINQKRLELLKAFSNGGKLEDLDHQLLQQALDDRIKTEVDHTSQRLMRLRLEKDDERDQELIKKLAEERLILRRLGWRADFNDLSAQELRLLISIVPKAEADHEALLASVKRRLKLLGETMEFRGVAGGREIAAVVSLHLSSHGDGLGAFNRGWLYPLRQEVNRVGAYSVLNEALNKAAAKSLHAENGLFKDTLRPSRLRSWQSYFGDRPSLGGEVSALAGYLGITLATTSDSRPFWGTPYDDINNINWDFAKKQSELVTGLISGLAGSKKLQTGQPIKNGFSTVVGRAKFIRHGELFPDQAAPDTVIMAFQGPSRYYAMVDATGMFQLTGVADKKHVLDKVIIEGYRFDNDTGKVIWAIDKKQTGKEAYRLRMQRKQIETDLVMFSCRQSTLFNLLEPRSLRYMTNIQLLDGRLEAPPLRYWWSRIDTRSSIIASLFLEPGVRFKMTLSDTVLDKKLVLLNADEEDPEGHGYLVDEWPALHQTELLAARDMWTLLKPRVANLEKRGIYDEKIKQLQQEGIAALETAETELVKKNYDLCSEAALKSWALATRVYSQVEKTQKDVLFGVLFYIALFVPFAFCVERFLFSFTDINKRILAFLGILLLLIAIIYNVHPAFQLAYSPTVVILAFFIMGLSLVVTLIIFFRFEEEMVLLQKRAGHMNVAEISRWQAFVASFFLGVSNLRRRRLRTILTCTTLIILTFTIMSFTSVKSLSRRARILYNDATPYSGVLLKNSSWRDIPPESYGTLQDAFEDRGILAPRAWLECQDRTQSILVPVRHRDREFQARGMVGFSPFETNVSGFDKILKGGRWFKKGERKAVILPDRMAAELGVDQNNPSGKVLLWGVPYNVIGVFSTEEFRNLPDLDGEPLTPVTFPGEITFGLSEVEMEALESGEDVRAFQSRYHHISEELIVLVPFEEVMALGGHFKSISLKPNPEEDIQSMAGELVDRFKLTIFLGEQGGTFLYHASDTLSYSGVPNIIIPLAISVFIVLNTMIGSVYERKREIGIYTSVGLAPSHVSFLFIAEAMAFAVLSVVLGYLLAQGSASIFAGTDLWSGITVNYSSLAGVAAMILIFLVVLLSVIYPSRVAAQIAIPDVTRAWTLPDEVDNALEITLPILMKLSEARGIGGYMLSYFKSHQDISHGIFSTADTDVTFMGESIMNGNDTDDHPLDTCLRFRSKVWLAPFDFGIMQDVNVEFCPSVSDPGFLEIKVALVRRAGEANSWRRINKSFINRLRKQILVWRSLDQEARVYFRQIMDAAQEETQQKWIEHES